ncbi:hypothetical protein JXJ21_09840 [candidate division KSB1 bacterium]|nr:hypothetical protein [candidate division KSB1 bacterium]
MLFPPQLIGHFLFMLLMILLLISGILKAHNKNTNWLNIHRGLVLAGVLSGIIGFSIMAIAKQLSGRAHFVSPHSKGGLITLILALITPILGTLLIKQILKQKMIHRISGFVTLIVGVLAATFGIIRVLS